MDDKEAQVSFKEAGTLFKHGYYRKAHELLQKIDNHYPGQEKVLSADLAP